MLFVVLTPRSSADPSSDPSADASADADQGPARPTGGCGAVAVLVGPDAPLVIDMKTRASYACDVWDFFKPDMDSEYPRVRFWGLSCV